MNLYSISKIDLSNNKICILKPMTKLYYVKMSSHLDISNNKSQNNEFIYLTRVYFDRRINQNYKDGK